MIIYQTVFKAFRSMFNADFFTMKDNGFAIYGIFSIFFQRNEGKDWWGTRRTCGYIDTELLFKYYYWKYGFRNDMFLSGTLLRSCKVMWAKYRLYEYMVIGNINSVANNCQGTRLWFLVSSNLE